MTSNTYLEDQSSPRTYYILYETKNLVNGKLYRGMHATKNPHDGYKGSGISLKLAIDKYGKENFETVHLCYATSVDNMAWLEKYEFVTEGWVADRNTYNRVVGGSGRHDVYAGDKLFKMIETSAVTNMSKYGSSSIFESQYFKDKKKSVMLERYGVEHSMQSSIVKDKRTRTVKERYGVDSVLQSPMIKEKKVNTNLSRYGVEYEIQTPQARKRVSLRVQKYTYTFVSPFGQVFDVTNFIDFCDLHNLDSNIIYRQLFSNGLSCGVISKLNHKNGLKIKAQNTLNTLGWFIQRSLIK